MLTAVPPPVQARIGEGETLSEEKGYGGTLSSCLLAVQFPRPLRPRLLSLPLPLSPLPALCERAFLTGGSPPPGPRTQGTR